MNQLALHDTITLADHLRAVMRGSGGCDVCAWCGSATVSRRATDQWPPRVSLTCSRCGTEIVADRRLARGVKA